MAARFQAFRIGNQEIVLQANRRGAAPTHWKEFNMTLFTKALIKETVSSQGHFIVRTWHILAARWKTSCYSCLKGEEKLIVDETSDSEARALERHQQWAVHLEHQEYLVPKTA